MRALGWLGLAALLVACDLTPATPTEPTPGDDVPPATPAAPTPPAEGTPPTPTPPPPEPPPPATLTCGYAGADVYACRRSPADASAWEVIVGDGRRWVLAPDGVRRRVEGSVVGWLEASASGSTLQIRPTVSMRAAGCMVRTHGRSAETC